MKTFLTLSLAALLLAGCSGQEDSGTESDYSDLYDIDDTDSTHETDTDGEEVIEDDGATSVGPTTIPNDLIPSRPQ